MFVGFLDVERFLVWEEFVVSAWKLVWSEVSRVLAWFYVWDVDVGDVFLVFVMFLELMLSEEPQFSELQVQCLWQELCLWMALRSQM